MRGGGSVRGSQSGLPLTIAGPSGPVGLPWPPRRPVLVEGNEFAEAPPLGCCSLPRCPLLVDGAEFSHVDTPSR